MRSEAAAIWVGYGWCAAAALASALASLFIKFAHQSGTLGQARPLAWLAGAAGAYVLGFAAYALALRKLDVSLGYPVMVAITMVLVVGFGYVFLAEPLALRKLIGIGIISVGIFMLVR
jgi:small multidrug resistance pump